MTPVQNPNMHLTRRSTVGLRGFTLNLVLLRYIGGGPTAARAGRLLRRREHRLSKRLSAEKSSAWSPITLLAQPPPKSDSGMGLPKAASYGWSGGYAALTCFPDDTTVLTVEYKINFIAPAAGDHLQAEGIVLKWGRTLTVCRLEVHAIQAERQMLVAAGQQTLICLPDATSPSARHAGCWCC